MLPADFDNNGAPGFFIANNNGLGQLLYNTIENHQWLGIQLHADDVILMGTKITLTIKNQQQAHHLYQTYGAHDTFLCQGDDGLLFGLDTIDDDSQLELSIQWPDGTSQIFLDLEKGRY